MVLAMDTAIGNVTDALESAGMLDDTVIVFTSDVSGKHMYRCIESNTVDGCLFGRSPLHQRILPSMSVNVRTFKGD